VCFSKQWFSQTELHNRKPEKVLYHLHELYQHKLEHHGVYEMVWISNPQEYHHPQETNLIGVWGLFTVGNGFEVICNRLHMFGLNNEQYDLREHLPLLM
jgi:hypothetical protein